MTDRKIYASDDILRLVEYRPSDDRALYEDWLDPDTQRGYNCIFKETFEEFIKKEIRQRFFAMVRLNGTGEIIGAVGISPPETVPDLAVWIFRPFRRKGYGTSAFALAAKYATEELKISELHAGAYPDNTGSRKILERCGFVPYPEGNIPEKHYMTGEDIIQMDYIYKPVTIRLAVPADAPDMAEVHMRSWEAAYKDIIPAEYIRKKNAARPELYKQVLADGNTNKYVIQYIGKTVGIMCAAPPQDDDLYDCCELHYLYLHPDYFRRGIGTYAMEFAYHIARDSGKSGIVLWVLEKNADSIKFYEKCGFIADGHSRESNFGKFLRSIRMRREL